jgi:glycine betaine monooxygenase B
MTGYSAYLGAGLPDWDAEADDILVCRQIRAETADVKSFTFSARTPHRFHFKPGQFLTLSLEIGGAAVERCYTIASSPTRPCLVTITVKRVAGGLASNWLHDQLRPGMEIRAFGPLGDFTAFDRPAGKHLFLSAGSGITPLMSMARAWHDLAAETDVVFVQSAHSPADLIFRPELELLAASQPGFRLAQICSQDAPGWSGWRGRLSRPMLELIAPDLREREVFCCGPESYRAAVRAMLIEAGCDPARYHEESFAVETAPPDEPVAVPQGVPRFRIELARSRQMLDCAADQTILDAARRAGLRLPSACSRGLCGTCKSKLVTGEVVMNHAGGIRQREIDQGQILLCCSTPRGDLVIER